MGEWEVDTGPIEDWLSSLDAKTYVQVMAAVSLLRENGPHQGRPLVETIKGSRIHNMKELRPGSSGTSEIRILFIFDPWRRAILLIGGDKHDEWDRWYRLAIPEAERRYDEYLTIMNNRKGH